MTGFGVLRLPQKNQTLLCIVFWDEFINPLPRVDNWSADRSTCIRNPGG